MNIVGMDGIGRIIQTENNFRMMIKDPVLQHWCKKWKDLSVDDHQVKVG
jgi:hypothetical protein